jgi:hypothetical protein
LTTLEKIDHPGKFQFDGKLLGLRCIKADFTSHGGFVNPTKEGEEVFAPDWNPEPVCGGGLHYVPWGVGHDGQDHGYGRPVWQVVEPIGEVVILEGKCKSKGLRVVHTGTLSECWKIIQPGNIAFTEQRADGIERSTGDSSSAASTGYRSSAASTGDSSSAASTGYSSSAASTGYRSSAASTGYSSSAASTGDSSSAASTGDSSSAASTGYRSSAASTGYRSSAASTCYRSSAASTGDSSSAASTGYRSSAASTGDSSSAASTGDCTGSICTGPYGKARAGSFGCIALAGYFEVDGSSRLEMRVARIGVGDGSDGLLKADVWYSLNEAGEFVEA